MLQSIIQTNNQSFNPVSLDEINYLYRAKLQLIKDLGDKPKGKVAQLVWEICQAKDYDNALARFDAEMIKRFLN